jgi:hypothetical protein
MPITLCKTMLPPICKTIGKMTVPVIIPTVLQILQDYVSYSSLQNYASQKIFRNNIHAESPKPLAV